MNLSAVPTKIRSKVARVALLGSLSLLLSGFQNCSRQGLKIVEQNSSQPGGSEDLTSESSIITLSVGSIAASGTAKRCLLEGKTLASGEEASFFSQSSIFSEEQPRLCETVQLKRTCVDGQLSGDSGFKFAKCEDYSQFQKLAHGELYISTREGSPWVTAYYSSSPCTSLRIDWGDGEAHVVTASKSPSACSQAEVVTAQVSHDYSASGDYSISLRRAEAEISRIWYLPKKSVTVSVRIGSSLGASKTLSSDGAMATAPSSEGDACKMPRYYSYTLTSDVNIGCDSSFAGRSLAFLSKVPDEGFALSRATLKIRNNSSIAGGWSINAYVGDGAGASYDMADNIPPGQTAWKTVLGSGGLSPNRSEVRVSGYHYSSQSCSSGGFSVLAGSTLEVWVEDPRTQCRGKYVGLKSNYATGGREGVWGTDFLSIDIPESKDANQVLLVSSIEGTLEYCSAGQLSTVVSTPYHSVLGSAVTDSAPTAGIASGALCHLSLATSNTVPYPGIALTATLHPRASISGGVYSGIRAGGPYAGSAYGEALIGFVKFR